MPITLYRINSREEYDSPEGKRKRYINEQASRLTGAAAGAIAGAALGVVAAKMIRYLAPGKANASVKAFDRYKDNTGLDLISRYRNNYVTMVGAQPRKVPPEVYAPLMLGLTGAAAGMFPAEYKAKKSMERSVGVKPEITWPKYKRTDMYGFLGGATAGAAVASTIGGARRKLSKGAGPAPIWYKNYPALSGVAAGLAVEGIVEKLIENKLNAKEEQK